MRLLRLLPSAVVVFCLTGCSDDSGQDNPGTSVLTGYWLWAQQVDNGAVKVEITEADLETKVGSNGWPGCPNGILCTHYGIEKLAFGGGGKAHFVFNPNTSSDFQVPGTYAVNADVVHYQGTEHFSCAHPDQHDTNPRDTYFRYKFEGDRLWVSVTKFTGFDLPFPTAAPQDSAQWVVFRSISREDYYGKYMIRICQGTSSNACNPLCDSTTLVD